MSQRIKIEIKKDVHLSCEEQLRLSNSDGTQTWTHTSHCGHTVPQWTLDNSNNPVLSTPTKPFAINLPSKAKEFSVVCDQLREEIKQADTIMERNRIARLVFRNREKKNGFWSRDVNSKTEATVRVFGEIHDAQVGVYGDAAASRDETVSIFFDSQYTPFDHWLPFQRISPTSGYQVRNPTTIS